MRKQNPGWILLGALVCVAVTVAILACLPAWEGMGDMSALDAIVYWLKNPKS